MRRRKEEVQRKYSKHNSKERGLIHIISSYFKTNSGKERRRHLGRWILRMWKNE